MDMEGGDALHSVQMHQTDAVELVKSGAMLLALDVPSGTTFGLNNKMFVVGPNFKGVKMLPPGPHFVYYSSKSKHGGDSSPVTGYFLYTYPSQVFVRRWDVQEEILLKLQERSEEEGYELAARRMEFDQHLAPYNVDDHKNWQLLSAFITQDVIKRIEPVGGNISVMAEAALVQGTATTAAEQRMYDEIAKGKEWMSQRYPAALAEDGTTKEGEDVGQCQGTDQLQGRKSSGRCFYTKVPHTLKEKSMTASELTASNMDKSQVLEELLSGEYQGHEELLLGELQFAFVAFLMGQSLESFVQWKDLVSLLLSCDEAPLRTRTELYVKFLRVIYYQLRQGLRPNKSNDTVPILDDSWLSEDNFFKLSLKGFLDMLREESPVDGELLRQATRVKKLVEETMGWIFEAEIYIGDEDDEYAPAVLYFEDIPAANSERMES